MSTITQCFQPPLYWQQFEDLTEGVFRAVYSDPKPTKFGRPGQAQNGVDVYGRDADGNLIGIQCKRMDERDENNHPRPGGKILLKHLKAEIEEAKQFSPDLHTWILATTAKRDAGIQAYARRFDEKSRADGLFGIQVWFWDDFITDLNRNHDLQRWYYADVIQVTSPKEQDEVILDLIAVAFARAAFRTPLDQETPSEFIQALKDTQHALNTGELKDRETRRVIQKAIGGRRAVEDRTISRILRNAHDELQLLRDGFVSGVKSSAISQCGPLWSISPTLLVRLNGHREAAIKNVNDALAFAGLREI